MKLSQIEFAYVFLGGFYLAMAALHIILYIYNRHRKSNLIYAVGLILVAINYTLIDISSEISYSSTNQKMAWLINAATNGVLVYFVAYYLLASSIPALKNIVRTTAALYTAAFIVMAMTSPDRELFAVIDMLLRITCYSTAVGICIFGLVRRIQNFYLIVTATAMLILTEVFLAVDLFDIWSAQNAYPVQRVIFIMIGYTAPYLVYSSYLSKDLALTTKKLNKELILNEKLTQEKYEQELITRRLLEAQNSELEKNVLERTREISVQTEKIEKQAAKIIEMDKIKSQFFANISHEFRTPLTLILGPVKKRLLEAVNPKDIKEYRIIDKNAAHLLQLVNQLFDLSRIESGALVLNSSPTPLISFITPIVEAFQSLAEVKMIDLIIDAQLPEILVEIDHEKMEKIINNLLSNAIKFTPAGGTVTLTLKTVMKSDASNDGFVEIHVSDTGIGIKKEDLSKVTERFFQVDSSQTRRYEGTGIGLSITKDFVDLHKGELIIESEFGVGTITIIRLPIQINHVQDALLRASNIENLSTVNGSVLSNGIGNHHPSVKVILVVEDNDDLREYIKMNLSETYEILEASDGVQGLTLATQHIPDLVISDLMMPRLDGIELCMKLKNDERTNHIPIIMLTAKADMQSKLEGLTVGADDYISKPFDIDEVTIRVLNLLENRKKLQDKYSRQLLLKPSDVEIDSAAEKFLQKTMKIVEEHISDSTFTVDKFAEEVCMSPAQLYRKLTALTPYTPNDFVRHIRLQRAASLIDMKIGNIADVAYRVGFNNLSYFTKCFKEKYALTPSDFAKREA